jgi:hypothetical protein
MDNTALRRKDTTKGPPLRILSLGKDSAYPTTRTLLTFVQMAEVYEDTRC